MCDDIDYEGLVASPRSLDRRPNAGVPNASGVPKSCPPKLLMPPLPSPNIASRSAGDIAMLPSPPAAPKMLSPVAPSNEPAGARSSSANMPSVPGENGPASPPRAPAPYTPFSGVEKGMSFAVGVANEVTSAPGERDPASGLSLWFDDEERAPFFRRGRNHGGRGF